MSKELEAKIATSKSWNIGSINKNYKEDGSHYSAIRIPKEVRIFFGDTELDIKRNAKGVGTLNLYKLNPDSKSEALKQVEQQYKFEKTHDVSAKLDRD